MARQRPIVPTPEPSVNGERNTPEPTPARESETRARELFEEEDTSFDPVELEQSAAEQPPAAAGSTAIPDPFDPESLRLTQDHEAATGVKKVLLSVPVRKPGKSEFVRVHSDPAYRLQTGTIDLKDDRELYLVARNLWPDLAAEANFRPKLLVTAITRQGVLFLWPLNLPRPDGKMDEWTRTARDAARMAETSWIRITANMALGGYDVAQAVGQLDDPVWPALSFRDLLRLAFRDKHVTAADHPVLRRLRGEV